jgi:RNA polymerase sigma-70 factor, ECF subfamily
MQAATATLAQPATGDGRDAELLRLTAQRDRRAFETLFRGYCPRLARFLTRFSMRPEQVDEVINDTFWVVWQKAGEFRGHSQVSTWIIGIAYRRALKTLAAYSSHASEPLNDEHEDGAARQEQVSRDLRDWVEKGLHYLPAEQRMTIELAYFLGHSCEEIAGIMDCSVGTVKARMFHARVKLRNLLPALGGEDRDAYANP